MSKEYGNLIPRIQSVKPLGHMLFRAHAKRMLQ